MHRSVTSAGIALGLMIVTAPFGAAQAQGVQLNPGAVTGRVQVGSETISSLVISAESGSLNATQTLTPNANAANYDLTVQVEAGGARSYDVTADIRTDGDRNFLRLRDRQVEVLDGQPATLDFVLDPASVVEGTVTVTGGGTIGSLLVRADQAASPSDSAFTSFGVGGNPASVSFAFPVPPGQPLQCSGSVRLTGGLSIDLPVMDAVPATPAAGGSVRCDYTVATPATGSIAGTADFSGPAVVDRYDFFVTRAGRMSFTAAIRPFDGPDNATSYAFADLTPGNYGFRTTNTRAVLNNLDDTFTWGTGAYSAGPSFLNVVRGRLTAVDFAACQAFLNGRVEFTGTASLEDLSRGSAQARGNPPLDNPSRLGVAEDRMTTGTGEFDLIVSEGDWLLDTFELTLRRPVTDVDGFLDERMTLTVNTALTDVITVGCGEIVERDVAFPTGSVTVNFSVADGSTLSNPELRFGTCERRDDTTNALLYTYTFDAFSEGQVNVTDGSVTFEGPAGMCRDIQARANVGGSRTTFATIDQLEILPGIDTVVDIGGPKIAVTFPEPGLIVDASEITVTGLVTDDADVAGVTVNGVDAVLTPSNNPGDLVEMRFEAAVPLPVKGRNEIVVVATDSIGLRGDNRFVVFNDSGPPQVALTPADGATTGELSVDVQGAATDDAGIQTVEIRVNGTEVVVLDGLGSPRVDFDEPGDLQAGANTITVVATDISGRSTTVVHGVTVVDNAPPVVADMAVTTDVDTAVAVTLDGRDPDGDPITFKVMGEPANGTLSGAMPDLTYTPNPGFDGADSFQYQASDGDLDSAMATVSITVMPANTPPVAHAGRDITRACRSRKGTAVRLNGRKSHDADGDPLTFAWDYGTGEAEGVRPRIRLMPGAHEVTLTVSDGVASATDTTVVTIKDRARPKVRARLVRVRNWYSYRDWFTRRYRVQWSARDKCDPEPEVTAELRVRGLEAPIPVDEGQIIALKYPHDGVTVETANGVLHIAAKAAALRVVAEDASGNTGKSWAKAKSQRASAKALYRHLRHYIKQKIAWWRRITLAWWGRW